MPSSSVLPPAPPSVEISFRISREGGISNITLQKSSGIDVLDRSALKAIATAGTLPRLPEEWQIPHLDVVIVFDPRR